VTSVIESREARARHRRHIGRGALAAAILAILAVLYAVLPPFGQTGPRRVIIVHGLTLREIARQLHEAGVVRSPLALRIAIRVVGSDRRLQAGTYEFRPGLSLVGVMDALTQGSRPSLWITIPEGLTDRDTAMLVESVLPGQGAPYLASARDPRLAAALGVDVDPHSPGDALEGYLFPDTYALAPGTTGEEVVRLQVRTFWSQFDSAHVAAAAAFPGGVRGVVTIASIVERESSVLDERPRIAAVFWRRLAIGMPLQADPTVRFALGAWDRPLTADDLAVASPWNTYREKGMPPGPISNPGRASLEATLHPTPGEKALYFVATGNGTHVFSATLPQHAEERRRLRKAGASEGNLMRASRREG